MYTLTDDELDELETMCSELDFESEDPIRSYPQSYGRPECLAISLADDAEERKLLKVLSRRYDDDHPLSSDHVRVEGLGRRLVAYWSNVHAPSEV
jgi:hypothetical protein